MIATKTTCRHCDKPIQRAPCPSGRTLTVCIRLQCRRARSRAYHAANREAVHARKRADYLANREAILAAAAARGITRTSTRHAPACERTLASGIARTGKNTFQNSKPNGAPHARPYSPSPRARSHHLGLVVFLGLQMPSTKKTPSRKAEGFTMPE